MEYTKEEAIILMELGEKMTHTYFSKDEWITIKNGEYLFEDGYMCGYREFWEWRNSTEWQSGWKVFNS